MKGTYLGEFQEIVLLSIMVLEDNAYGISIQDEIRDRTGREISRGALHAALKRLEEKGFISSQFGEATAVRGGRRKKLYTVTQAGERAVVEAREMREVYWEVIPKLSS